METVWLGTSYMDAGLAREERLCTTAAADVFGNHQRRVSRDNGRTWSALEPVRGMVCDTPQGGMALYFGAHAADLKRGYRLSALHAAALAGHAVLHHAKGQGVQDAFGGSCVRDRKRARSQPDEIRGRPGFQSRDPFAPAFLQTNRAYYGSGMAIGRDGAVYFPVACVTGVRPGRIEAWNRPDAAGSCCGRLAGVQSAPYFA